jgi:hypothetical protein
MKEIPIIGSIIKKITGKGKPVVAEPIGPSVELPPGVPTSQMDAYAKTVLEAMRTGKVVATDLTKPSAETEIIDPASDNKVNNDR